MTKLLLFLAFVTAVSNSCSPTPTAAAQQPDVRHDAITTDTLVADSLLFFAYRAPQNYTPALTQIRPSQSDSGILLCVAAAFTRLDNLSIDGLFAVDGNVTGTVNKRLGGGCRIAPATNTMTMFATNDGQLLTAGWIDSNLVKPRASFFQQLQLVRNSKALRYGKDVSLFQRRAVVLSTNGSTSVIESARPITLQQFADALVKLGAQDAMYLDMGGWDEGWIRLASGKTSRIGLMCTSTNRQSNWLIFRKKR